MEERGPHLTSPLPLCCAKGQLVSMSSRCLVLVVLPKSPCCRPLTPRSVAAALVGRLGSAPLGAVGASTILHNFSGFLFSFLMVVTTPRVARAVANADMAEVGTTRHAACA